MKKSFGICLLLMSFTLIILGCGEGGKNDPRTVVDSFATSYFNWRFKDAEQCVTRQSIKWLRFAASQVDSEDVDSLRAMKYSPIIDVQEINDIDDSTVIATVSVSDFLTLDSIGKHPRKSDMRKFQIPVSLTADYWRVKLTRLP